jgi:histidyl-tRNA synthetase
VFLRAGDSTDIVRKEMYDFEDKGGRRVAVRPEFTAGVMRAFAEHRPAVPWKAWTAGPAFRYEAPQAGRYRQHFQLDAEIVGTDDPDSDVEVIALLDGFHRALGLSRRSLVVNSLGDDETRAAYLTALTTYLTDHRPDPPSRAGRRWPSIPYASSTPAAPRTSRSWKVRRRCWSS